MSAYRKRPLDVGDDEEGSAGVSTTTKAVVEAALAEERAAKLAKGGRNTVLPSRELEGKTVRFVADGEDADDVEEGPIKEKMVGKAVKHRILMRTEIAANMRGEGDVTNNIDDVEKHEAKAGLQLDDDEKEESFVPFNLNSEREEGYFDADGNYIEYKVDEDESDEWLKGVDADEKFATGGKKSSSHMVLSKDHDELSEVQIARMKGELAGYLQPRETVLQALKRLGSSGGTNLNIKRSQAGLVSGKVRSKGGNRVGSNATSTVALEHQSAFAKITELSSTLMSNGEYDVYNLEKESFERAARLFVPVRFCSEDKRGVADMFADDMFGEDEPGDLDKRISSEEKADVEPAKPDLSSMSIKDLKEYISAHGGDPTGAVEKDDLVARAEALKSHVRIPAGYVLDPSTAMYYSAASGMWYSPDNSGFTDGQGNWWYFDSESQQFVPWQAQL